MHIASHVPDNAIEDLHYKKDKSIDKEIMCTCMHIATYNMNTYNQEYIIEKRLSNFHIPYQK